MNRTCLRISTNINTNENSKHGAPSDLIQQNYLRMTIDDSLLQKLYSLRHNLHANPELSGNEELTSRMIKSFLSDYNPSNLIENIGRHSLLAIFDSGVPGPTVLFRADMDALPIEEKNDIPYCSSNIGIAHLCGHDGHSAILAGMACLLNIYPPSKGKVMLFFQAAEETGEGALLAVEDLAHRNIKADFCFALHNLPSFEKAAVLIKDGTFAAASSGMVIQLEGKTSHAAHPENGLNPDLALASLIIEINKLNKGSNIENDFSLITIIHARLGNPAFGTSPAFAGLMLTIRAFSDEKLHDTIETVKKLAIDIAASCHLKLNFSFKEPFPATVNHPVATQIIVDSAQRTGLDLIKLKQPFRWSEDFGHFSKIAPSAMFGLGCGMGFPQLHNENYNFPDEIIKTGLMAFYQIANTING